MTTKKQKIPVGQHQSFQTIAENANEINAIKTTVDILQSQNANDNAYLQQINDAGDKPPLMIWGDIYNYHKRSGESIAEIALRLGKKNIRRWLARGVPADEQTQNNIREMINKLALAIPNDEHDPVLIEQSQPLLCVVAKPPEKPVTAKKHMPDTKLAQRFLEAFDPSAKIRSQVDGMKNGFTFQTFDDLKKRKEPSLTRILQGTLEEHADELIRLNQQGAGVFFTVNETDMEGRRLANITRVRANWVEDDSGTAPETPIEPHFIVESSPGKYHT